MGPFLTGPAGSKAHYPGVDEALALRHQHRQFAHTGAGAGAAWVDEHDEGRTAIHPRDSGRRRPVSRRHWIRVRCIAVLPEHPRPRTDDDQPEYTDRDLDSLTGGRTH